MVGLAMNSGNLRALILRRGFWAVFYHDYNYEGAPQNVIGIYLRMYVNLESSAM